MDKQCINIENTCKFNTDTLELDLSSITKKDSNFGDDDSNENILEIKNSWTKLNINLNSEKKNLNKNIYLNFLKIHDIKEKHRAKMIDWIISVLNKLNYDYTVIFKSILIMDEYLRKNKTQIKLDELHWIGIVSMLIASKREKYNPLNIELIYEKIAKKKFEIIDIINKEMEFIEIISNRINKKTMYDIILNYLNFFKLDDILTKKTYDYLISITKYFLFIFLWDLEIITNYTMYEMIISCLIISLKLIEKFNEKIQAKYFFKIIIKESGLNEDIITKKIKDMHNKAINFKNKFNYIKEIDIKNHY